MTDETSDEFDYSGVDTDTLLARMFRIKRKLVPDLEQEYERLRDEAMIRLDSAQPFLDADGDKQVAFPVRPDKTIIDEKRVMELLPPELLDYVAPRKVNRTRLAEINARTGGEDEVFTDQEIDSFLEIREGAGTPHIRFDDASGRA